MSGLDGSKGYLRLAARSLALLLATSAVTFPEPNSSALLPDLRESLASNVRISDPARAAAVRKALLGAFDRLGDAKCQGIFSDFHEALHSLGLGENPPTSDEITWKVFSRCAG